MTMNYYKLYISLTSINFSRSRYNHYELNNISLAYNFKEWNKNGDEKMIWRNIVDEGETIGFCDWRTMSKEFGKGDDELSYIESLTTEIY